MKIFLFARQFENPPVLDPIAVYVRQLANELVALGDSVYVARECDACQMRSLFGYTLLDYPPIGHKPTRVGQNVDLSTVFAAYHGYDWYVYLGLEWCYPERQPCSSAICIRPVHSTETDERWEATLRCAVRQFKEVLVTDQITAEWVESLGGVVWQADSPRCMAERIHAVAA